MRVMTLPELAAAGVSPELAAELSRLNEGQFTARMLEYTEEFQRRFREERSRYFQTINEEQAEVWELLRSRELRLLVISGGNQAGKSELLTQAICQLHQKAGPLWERFGSASGPFYTRECCPDFEKGVKGVLIPKWRELAVRSNLRGGTWDNAYSVGEQRLIIADGGLHEWMTYRQDVSLHQGAQRHVIGFHEWPPELIYRESIPRLFRYGGLIIIAATPTTGEDEIWQMQLEESVARGEIAGSALVYLRTEKNTKLDPEWVRMAKEEMTEDEQLMRLFGRRVSFGGRILGMLNARVHLIEHFLPPEGVPTCVCLDVHDNKPNYANFSMILTPENTRRARFLTPEGQEIQWPVKKPQLHVWEEFTCADTVEKTCEYLGYAAAGRSIDAFFFERSQKRFDHNTGRSVRTEFQARFPFRPWSQDAVGGRNILAKLARVDEITNETQFFVHSNCRITWDQLRSWSYKTVPGNKIDEVRKINDDMCDCCRAHAQWHEGHACARPVRAMRENVPRLVYDRDPITNAVRGYRYSDPLNRDLYPMEVLCG